MRRPWEVSFLLGTPRAFPAPVIPHVYRDHSDSRPKVQISGGRVSV